MTYTPPPITCGITIQINLDETIRNLVETEIKRREKENAVIPQTKSLDEFKNDIKRLERKLKKQSKR